MSDMTGVHPVADKAVMVRITATLTLLVMRDTNVLHSSLCPPGSSEAWSVASGRLWRRLVAAIPAMHLNSYHTYGWS